MRSGLQASAYLSSALARPSAGNDWFGADWGGWALSYDGRCLVLVGGAVMHAAAGWLVMRHHPRYGFCAECEDPFAKRRRGVNPFDGLVSGIKGP